MSNPFAFVPRRVPAGWTDLQTDRTLNRAGISTYNHVWPYRSFLISYSKAKTEHGLSPFRHVSLTDNPLLLPCRWIILPSSVKLPDQTASASKAARVTVDGQKEKGLDPPAKAATNTYARTKAVVTPTNHDPWHTAAHGRLVGCLA